MTQPKTPFARQHYVVTGVKPNGGRFRLRYERLYWAECFNLWRASVWAECLDTGKRKLIRRAYN